MCVCVTFNVWARYKKEINIKKAFCNLPSILIYVFVCRLDRSRKFGFLYLILERQYSMLVFSTIYWNNLVQYTKCSKKSRCFPCKLGFAAGKPGQRWKLLAAIDRSGFRLLTRLLCQAACVTCLSQSRMCIAQCTYTATCRNVYQ